MKLAKRLIEDVIWVGIIVGGMYALFYLALGPNHPM